MLKERERQLNDLVVDIYQNVQRVEERMLRNTKLELTITETNILEIVGRAGEKGASISEISSGLGFAAPTVTVAVGKLSQKGYVEKRRSEEDRRVFHVVLTKRGRKADAVHRYFHEQAVRATIKGASDADIDVLMSAMRRLDEFLKNNL